jgi:hypothetical protein
MRRIFLLCVLLGLAGCQNVSGPFAPRTPSRVDDPRLTINEQESRGRDRWAIPEQSNRIMPGSGEELRRR